MTKAEYEERVRYMNLQARAYYDYDTPEISDEEYDAKMRELKAVEWEHPDWINPTSPTQRVGGDVGKVDFTKVEHKVPMLSLEDVFSDDEVQKFLIKYPEEKYTVEQKIDGLSISVTYTDGYLTRAETRGNGYVGELITENAKHIDGIPHKIKTQDVSSVEVRCEVYLSVEDFERINVEKVKAGEKPFVNPRNAAAGILRTKNVDAVKSAHLRAFAFNIQSVGYVKGWSLDWRDAPAFGNSHYKTLSALREMGFSVVPAKFVSEAEVMSEIEKIGLNRKNLPYWIDGAVVKLDSLNLREFLGNTAKTPRWAIAFKYEPEEKTAIIKDIVLQTGRTGRVTPVAVFSKPIFLEGTSVGKATLNNPEFIKAMNVNVGDTVFVHKAASIIPEITGLAQKGSIGHYDVFACSCPSCGSKLIPGADENGNGTSGAYCNNPSCPAQFSRHIEFFCSRECMDIPGMGPAIIEKLIEKKWLECVNDIYRLSDYEVQMNEIFGKKTTENLLTAIEKSKDRSLATLVKSLGIEGVGKHIGQKLELNFPDLWAIARASVEKLFKIDGVGNVSAHAIYDFFHEDANVSALRHLEALGVNIKSQTFGRDFDGRLLSGLTFVITGTLPTMSREEMVKLIEENGGKVSNTISKKTDYLVAGENAGSKLKKAVELGKKILSEEYVITLCQSEKT